MSKNYEEHPALLVHVILYNIFKFCNFEDLKSCRLVSKYWLNESKRFWSLLAHVRIQEIGQENDKLMSDYIQFAAENELRDLVNFNIKLYSRVFNFTVLLKFWEIVGPRIKILKLDVNQFPNADSVRDILFKYFPNITSLSFRACYAGHTFTPLITIDNPMTYVSNYSAQENKNVKWISLSVDSLVLANISWMELLTNYPNLQGLQLVNFATERHVESLFATINTIREHDFKKLKLNDIQVQASCGHRIPSSLLKFLRRPDVQMESLALTLSSTEDILHTREIICRHESTMRNLELETVNIGLLNDGNSYLSEGLQIQSLFPRLSTLTLAQPLLKFLAFLKYMPNLTKLVIKKGYKMCDVTYPKISEITLASDMEPFNVATCTELELFHYENTEGTSKLIKWFPNVNKVKIPLSNETFELVCQGWTNLKSLNITNSTVDECGITGLDGKQVVRINNAKGNFCKRPATVPRANITALKKLKSFHMQKRFQFNSAYSVLNFCSVIHGFQRIACLKNISVREFDINSELSTRNEIIDKNYRQLTGREKE